MGVHSPAAQSNSPQGCNRYDFYCRYGNIECRRCLSSSRWFVFDVGKRTSGMSFHHFSAWLVPITQRLAALGAVALVRECLCSLYFDCPIGDTTCSCRFWPQPFCVTTRRSCAEPDTRSAIGLVMRLWSNLFLAGTAEARDEPAAAAPKQEHTDHLQAFLAQRLGDLSCCGTMFSGCLVCRGTACRVILAVAWTHGDTRAAWPGCGATGGRSGSVAGVGRADV